MRPDQTTEAEVNAALDRILVAYADRDMDALVAACVPDADLSMFGTGADERRVGLSEVQAQAMRDWGQSEAASFSLPWRHISGAGNVAWVAAEGSASVRAGGQDMSLPIRMTTVFERRDGRWLLAHMHASVPFMAQEEGQSFPTQ
ncbi:MAG TPA: nuclear transport factor 2 family protein [Roseiflexaceae bacterium]|nr:nuclear transport factor 2 family protein [Roseiflexaceae bacterium]